MNSQHVVNTDAIVREYQEWLRFQRSYLFARIFSAVVGTIFFGVLVRQGWFAFQLADLLGRNSAGWVMKLGSAMSRVEPELTYWGHEVILRETLRKMQASIMLTLLPFMVFWSLGRRKARFERFWSELRRVEELREVLGRQTQ